MKGVHKYIFHFKIDMTCDECSDIIKRILTNAEYLDEDIKCNWEDKKLMVNAGEEDDDEEGFKTKIMDLLANWAESNSKTIEYEGRED